MGSEAFILNPVRAIVEKKSITDFAIHPWSGCLAFACQDRLVRVYSIITSTEHHTFRGCPSYGGQLVKVQFDPSGQYLLTACSLKTINLLQSVTYAVKKEMAEMGRLSRGMVFQRSWKKSNIEPTNPKPVASEPALSSAEMKHQIVDPNKDSSWDGVPACLEAQEQQQQQLLQQQKQQPENDYAHEKETADAGLRNKDNTDPALALVPGVRCMTRSSSGQWDSEYQVLVQNQVESEQQAETGRPGEGSQAHGFNNSDLGSCGSRRGGYAFDFGMSSFGF
ncbi:mitogen-activated protein kinase binding protein 1 [Elysia marginata]|uniref:Mitogen-activated protein kinase binding protein 1 n=1 Tax=Elysia marginata TaxID=1093978 RepID=A0AAV4EPX4_9GAST|nr:mitogen-activated protein kinase binding protein 1 [Elysia marginata]